MRKFVLKSYKLTDTPILEANINKFLEYVKLLMVL